MKRYLKILIARNKRIYINTCVFKNALNMYNGSQNF